MQGKKIKRKQIPSNLICGARKKETSKKERRKKENKQASKTNWRRKKNKELYLLINK